MPDERWICSFCGRLMAATIVPLTVDGTAEIFLACSSCHARHALAAPLMATERSEGGSERSEKL